MKWLYEGRQREAVGQIGRGKGMAIGCVNGSHHIYTKDGCVERPSIPIHGNHSLKIGLQRALMKIMGISEGEL